jgi:hypothetical protein
MMSGREATGLESAPLANESAAEDAVIMLFILNDDVDTERLVDLIIAGNPTHILHLASFQSRRSVTNVHSRWSHICVIISAEQSTPPKWTAHCHTAAGTFKSRGLDKKDFTSVEQLLTGMENGVRELPGNSVPGGSQGVVRTPCSSGTLHGIIVWRLDPSRRSAVRCSPETDNGGGKWW